MRISTTRFGEIDADESRIIDMRGGILGFEHLDKYILHRQDEKTPFLWFQSVNDGATAFVIINPQIVKSDYYPEIGDDDMALLEIESVEDVVLMAIATIRANPFKVSANLRAPIVINARKRLAKQIVLEDPDYPVQFYLTTSDSPGKQENMGRECDRNEECNNFAL